MNFYESKDYLKVEKTFREKMKMLHGMKLRILKKPHEITIEGKTKWSSFNEFFASILIAPDRKILRIDSLNAHADDFYQFIEDAAKAVGMEMLFGGHQVLRNEEQFFTDKGFDCYEMSDYRYFSDGKQVESILLLEELRSKVFFKELIPNTTSQFQQLLTELDNFALDVTSKYASSNLTLTKIKSYPDLRVEIYHAGFEGYVEFTKFENGYEVKLWETFAKDHSWNTPKPKEIETPFSFLDSPGSLSKLMWNIFKECEISRRLLNLMEPPRKHFNAFMGSKFVGGAQISDTVYEYLSIHMDPLSIEDKIKNQVLNEVALNPLEVTLVEVLGFYFTINYVVSTSVYGQQSSQLDEVKAFSDKSLALEEFTRLLEVHEERKRKEQQQKVQATIQKAAEM